MNVICTKCGEEIGSSPMYAVIEASIDKNGAGVVEARCYHKQPQCLIELTKRVEAQEFRSSN